MSLTSYRTAPPRGRGRVRRVVAARSRRSVAAASREGVAQAAAAADGARWWWCGGMAAAPWPGGGRLSRPSKGQYHGRWGLSRPSSEWGRVGHPRQGHRAKAPPPAPARAAGTPPAPPLSLSSSAQGPRLKHGYTRGGPALPPGAHPARRPEYTHGLGAGRAGTSSLERLGPVGCTPRGASTPGLSTWSSPTALHRQARSRGGLPA
jgi:hypothetical protein